MTVRSVPEPDAAPSSDGDGLPAYEHGPWCERTLGDLEDIIVWAVARLEGTGRALDDFSALTAALDFLAAPVILDDSVDTLLRTLDPPSLDPSPSSVPRETDGLLSVLDAAHSAITTAITSEDGLDASVGALVLEQIDDLRTTTQPPSCAICGERGEPNTGHWAHDLCMIAGPRTLAWMQEYEHRKLALTEAVLAGDSEAEERALDAWVGQKPHTEAP